MPFTHALPKCLCVICMQMSWLSGMLWLLQVVISDVPSCGGWKYAAEHGIATVAYPASPRTVVNGNQTGVSTEELMRGLREHHEVDYVLLAGYLKVCERAHGPAPPRVQ